MWKSVAGLHPIISLASLIGHRFEPFPIVRPRADTNFCCLFCFRGAFSISATNSSVGQYFSATVPFRIASLVSWNITSICFVWRMNESTHRLSRYTVSSPIRVNRYKRVTLLLLWIISQTMIYCVNQVSKNSFNGLPMYSPRHSTYFAKIDTEYKISGRVPTERYIIDPMASLHRQSYFSPFLLKLIPISTEVGFPFVSLRPMRLMILLEHLVCESVNEPSSLDLWTSIPKIRPAFSKSFILKRLL